jgi:hypothetical protein
MIDIFGGRCFNVGNKAHLTKGAKVQRCKGAKVHKAARAAVAGFLAVSLMAVGLVPASAEEAPKGPRADVVSGDSHDGPASGLVSPDLEGGLAIPSKIVDSEEEMSKLPGVTVSISKEYPALPSTVSGEVSPAAIGVGSVIGRARQWQTASNGYIRKGYQKGTFSSVAGVMLAFVPGVAGITVSTALSVNGIVAAATNTVSGETLVSYRYTYRDGEGRWSSDPNTSGYWHLGYRTGKRETFRHVTSGKLDPKTQTWTLRVKNYTATAAKTEKSTNFAQSDSWLASRGQSYVTSGASYVETPW